MKIEIIKSMTGWYFRVVARNGRILCHSEIYNQKASCRKAVVLMQDAVWNADVVEK